MPPPTRPDLPRAAEPRYGRHFDAWNAVALGHQRADTRGPRGWRESRARKLQHQLAAGRTGGARLSDTVGAGSEDFDERRQVVVPKAVRARAAHSVVDMLRRPGTMSPGSSTAAPEGKGEGEGEGEGGGAAAGGEEEEEEEEEELVDNDDNEDDDDGDNDNHKTATAITTSAGGGGGGKIFDGLVVYVNGSTHPLVGDHRLKHLLVENGARLSIHLARRHVTHVILGKPSGPTGGGAGGGLAGGKLEREVRRVRGRGVKYVGVEWALESLKAGRRLPEARFANLKVASRAQPSVYGAFAGRAAAEAPPPP